MRITNRLGRAVRGSRTEEPAHNPPVREVAPVKADSTASPTHRPPKQPQRCEIEVVPEIEHLLGDLPSKLTVDGRTVSYTAKGADKTDLTRALRRIGIANPDAVIVGRSRTVPVRPENGR